ncbi:phosphoribosylformylglycinamidine synthase subunit PurS [Campylobacter sp. LH-2024]|uniref:Phosphoribosylformylglycinamidine synthase subunit PurS n=1 Tax=Campylobacter molothri TaxID=1032242 RepID=A0ACC5W0R4_9BACT|nr:phosphoribosylformylglycinamidine synthase subunit PurS [Campylobacter sp. 2018MI35]MBZ7928199.1 phosphoribosylformylglycinamidine synthase subunit PurS [Campylobacter sp. RM10542]MBZ7929968.1 phosphoribosylformylglycinamidine synthase subunit PurS [Campylobacter sp. W0067]MBZ7930990.1 phosphoribosylformylglycinamidine synthase subunit PurS [Campylobacter sp. RM12910]MBZ7934031.1 phosphoribosylformylglycinamidine synthase subunit PurS [Campylobacter sp. W0065]MBZ7937557.1 phosphoribosylform
MKIVINIFLKNGVLDPQGKAIEKALHSLNFNEVKEVRMAKQLILDLDEKDEIRAKERIAKMCEELLVNNVIEDYELSISEKL